MFVRRLGLSAKFDDWEEVNHSLRVNWLAHLLHSFSKSDVYRPERAFVFAESMLPELLLQLRWRI
jgi:hypothetical protein